MSMCLQGMVEELIMKKQGKKIKKVGGMIIMLTVILYYMKHDVRKEVLGVFDQVQHKPICAVTEIEDLT